MAEMKGTTSARMEENRTWLVTMGTSRMEETMGNVNMFRSKDNGIKEIPSLLTGGSPMINSSSRMAGKVKIKTLTMMKTRCIASHHSLEMVSVNKIIIEDGIRQHSQRLEEEDIMVLLHPKMDRKEVRERVILTDLLLDTIAEEVGTVTVDLPEDLIVDLILDLHNRTNNSLEITGITEIGTTLTSRLDKCLIL